MHRDSKGLAINTSFFQEIFQQNNTIVSHSRNNSGNQQLQNSAIAFQNLFKTLLLKQLFAGWVRILQKSKQHSLKRSQQTMNLRIYQQSQKQQLNQSEINGRIAQRQSQNVQQEEQMNKYRQIYKKYGRSKTYQERRSRTEQKIKIFENSNQQNNQKVKVLSSILQKLKKKKTEFVPHAVNQNKMDLRISKLEKMMVKIKREHQEMKCGKFIYKSQPKSSRPASKNPKIVHYTQEIKHLKQELEKVKVQNYKLTSSLGFINEKSYLYNQPNRTNFFSQQQIHNKIEVSQNKKNFLTPVKQQQYRNKKIFSSIEPPRFFTPLKTTLPTSEHVPSFITKNNSPAFQNPASMGFTGQNFQSKPAQYSNKILTKPKGNNLNTSSSLNYMPKNNQMHNPIQRKMLNPQTYTQAGQHGNSMLKMTKYENGGNLNNLMNMKICRPECNCCCHHGCKH